MSNVPPAEPNTLPTAQDKIEVTAAVSLTDHAVGSDTISISKTGEPTT